MITTQLQLLLSQIGSCTTLDAETGVLDISIDHDAITDVLLCRTIDRETLEKIEDFDFECEDEKMFQGDINIAISDDGLKVYWYSPILNKFPIYSNGGGYYSINLQSGTLKHFGEAIKQIADYQWSLRESEQFQKDAFDYIPES